MNATMNAVRITTRVPLVQQDRKTITTNFVYVSQKRSLPKVGDFVLAKSEVNDAEFPGQVIEVFSVRHGYVARIDLS